MSIESKHKYRFGYLKSDKWKAVRLEALVREHGKCQICGEESIFNDAHHVWYPPKIVDTSADHLVVLCRPCHEFVHAMLPMCKTNDEDEGKGQWLKLRNAIVSWRKEKIVLFQSREGVHFPDPKELRLELARLKKQLAECQKNLVDSILIQI